MEAGADNEREQCVLTAADLEWIEEQKALIDAAADEYNAAANLRSFQVRPRRGKSTFAAKGKVCDGPAILLFYAFGVNGIYLVDHQLPLTTAYSFHLVCGCF